MQSGSSPLAIAKLSANELLLLRCGNHLHQVESRHTHGGVHVHVLEVAQLVVWVLDLNEHLLQLHIGLRLQHQQDEVGLRLEFLVQSRCLGQPFGKPDLEPLAMDRFLLAKTCQNY